MPSFVTHKSNAVGLALFTGLVGFTVFFGNNIDFMTSITAAATCSGLVMLGAILPDIDHHASIPRKWLGVLGGITAISGWVMGTVYISAIMTRFFDSLILGGIVVAGLSFVGSSMLPVILAVAGSLFDFVLTHRGITHTLFFALLCSLAVYYFIPIFLNQFGDQIPALLNQFGIETLTENMRVILGGAIGIGILKHISDDDVSIKEQLE